MKRHFIHCLALVVVTCVAPVLFAESIPLSSLDLGQMTSGWNVAQAGHEVSGGPLIIHGEKFTDGAGAAAASKFRVRLDGNAKRFIANVGVDDSAGNQGSVEFIVSGDGNVLWQSGLLKGGDSAKGCGRESHRR